MKVDNSIVLYWDKKTGKFLGVEFVKGAVDRDIKEYGGSDWEPATTDRNLKYLKEFDFVQRDCIEFYHRAGSSICTTHFWCSIIKCPC